MKLAILIAAAAIAVQPIAAQGTLADYQRSQGLQTKARGLVVNTPGSANWIGATQRFRYSKSVTGGTQFMLVDASAASKAPAFDHQKLAAAISSVTGGHYTALTLPFAPTPGGRGGRGGAAPTTTSPLKFADDLRSLSFGTGGSLYRCSLSDYTCTKGGPVPQPAVGRGGRGVPEDDSDDPYASPSMVDAESIDGMEYLTPSPQDEDYRDPASNRAQPRCAERAGGPAATQGRGGCGGAASAEPQTCASFDGKWEALIQNFNVFLRPAGTTQAAIALSSDGSEGNYYTFRSIAWSPDSKQLVAYHVRPGYDRQVHYVESSPADRSNRSIPPWLTANQATRSISPIRRCSKSPARRKSTSTVRCSPTRTPSSLRCGGRMAAPSPSSTTSAATRCTA
jgi:hypothetical protein